MYKMRWSEGAKDKGSVLLERAMSEALTKEDAK